MIEIYNIPEGSEIRWRIDSEDDHNGIFGLSRGVAYIEMIIEDVNEDGFSVTLRTNRPSITSTLERIVTQRMIPLLMRRDFIAQHSDRIETEYIESLRESRMIAEIQLLHKVDGYNWHLWVDYETGIMVRWEIICPDKHISSTVELIETTAWEQVYEIDQQILLYLLIIGIIVVILGGTGYYLYQSRKATDTIDKKSKISDSSLSVPISAYNLFFNKL